MKYRSQLRHNVGKTRARYFDKGKPRGTAGRKVKDPSLAGQPGCRVEVTVKRELAVKPYVVQIWFYALFVGMFSVLALGGLMASFGATADGEPIMAIAFMIVTAVVVTMILTAYDHFRSVIR